MVNISPELDALQHLGYVADQQELEPLPPVLFSKLYLGEEVDAAELFITGWTRLSFSRNNKVVILSTKFPKENWPIGQTEEPDIAVRFGVATKEDQLRFGRRFPPVSGWFQLLCPKESTKPGEVRFKETPWIEPFIGIV